MKQNSVAIIYNKTLTTVFPEAHFLCIKAPEIAAKVKPGQFIMVKCGENTTLRRPFGIHSVELPDKVFLLFVKQRNSENDISGTRHGEGTEWLADCKQGDNLDIIGPLGNGFTVKPDSQKILLIAGGIGITPLAFLSHYGLQQQKSISLILGARKGEQLFLENLPVNKINLIVMTEDGITPSGIPDKAIYKKGKIGDDQQFLLEQVSKADQIFICGPRPMYQSLDKKLGDTKTTKDIQVSLEVRMGCGIGTCYGCSIHTLKGMKKVCKDGPVFTMEDVIWEEVRL